MRKVTAILIGFLLSVQAFSQTQYYDALNLKIKTINNTLELDTIVLTILNHYFPEINSTSDATDVKHSLKDNPFINSLEIKGTALSVEKFNPLGSYKNALSTIGGIDVTTFSKGLSMFLIERAKEELNVAFFQKFKDYFDKEENIAIRTLFPKTTEIIGSILAYQYPQMLPVLQEAFQSDMEALPNNILNLLILPKYFDEIEKFPELLVIFKLFNSLKQLTQLSPPELFDSLPKIAQFNKSGFDTLPRVQNLYTVLKLTEIVSNSVRVEKVTNDTTKYWVSSKDFYQKILKDSVARKIYLGLVYQQIKNEKLQINGKLIIDHINAANVKQEIYWFDNFLSKAVVQFDKISSISLEIKKKLINGEKPGIVDYCGYVNSTIDFTEFGIETARHFNPGINQNIRLISIVKNGNELIENTYSKNYSLAINNALTLLDTINNALEGKIVFIDPKLMDGMYKYGRFIGNVASAENPEDVKNAISAVALPSGSSSIKKYQRWNLTVNAYLGATARLGGKENPTSRTWNNPISMTTPIGLNLSFFPMEKRGSFSLFASLIDIGAIVDYQLTDSTKKSFEQKIYLENILSPGVYVVYGFWGNMPLALSVGGQYGPGLTKIGNNLKNPTWRWNVSLTVDIPMISLSQGRKKNKN
jgi:hypothetical protein